MTTKPELKVFQMSKGWWYVGASLEECVKAFQELVGDDPADVADACEVPDARLDTLKFVVRGRDDMFITRRTFRTELKLQVAEGGVFPRIFASTEH